MNTEDRMMRNPRKTAELGEVILTAFDEAAQYTADPRTVARLASLAVLRLWRRSEDSRLEAERLSRC